MDQIQVWSTEADYCVAWGTHDPAAARAAWTAEHPDHDDLDWERAEKWWADPAELDNEDQWTLQGQSQEHSHWAPFLVAP